MWGGGRVEWRRGAGLGGHPEGGIDSGLDSIGYKGMGKLTSFFQPSTSASPFLFFPLLSFPLRSNLRVFSIPLFFFLTIFLPYFSFFLLLCD